MSHHRRTCSITSLSEALSSHSPSSFSSSPQYTMDSGSTKYTATKLQCISNYKLRTESSKNEPRLDRLLGHISMYDAVREWRQSQARAGIETIMQATKRLSTPTVAPTPAPSPVQTVQEESELQPDESDIQLQPYLHDALVPSFSDFQAAIELQLASLEEVKAAHRQLQRMAAEADDGEEVEEYESDSEAGSDYDSYDGEEGDWRSEEGSDSEDSMTDPESVRSECTSPIQDVRGDKDDNDYFGPRPMESIVSQNPTLTTSDG